MNMKKKHMLFLTLLCSLVFFLSFTTACSQLYGPAEEAVVVQAESFENFEEEIEEKPEIIIKKEDLVKEKAAQEEQCEEPPIKKTEKEDEKPKEALEPEGQIEENQGTEGELEEENEMAGQESQEQEEASPDQTTNTEDPSEETAPPDTQEEIYKIGKYLTPQEESGSVNSNGLVAKNMVFVGDDDSNFTYGGFLTFNISMFLEKNVQIKIVRLLMREPVSYGDPVSLGTVDIRVGDYGELDYSDIWFSQTKMVSFPADTVEIDYGFGDERLANEMQKAVDSSKETFQFVIFRAGNNNNNQIDGLKYWFHNIMLQVNLESPVNF
jgi:hypothetical protein